MVIDASAFLAISYLEDEAEYFLREILSDTHCLVSAATMTEVGINLLNQSETTVQDFESLLIRARVKIVPVDEEQATIAVEAYRQFGKGRHPARLNFGDCFSYALSKQSGEPLLFKGNDFTRTDVARVF